MRGQPVASFKDGWHDGGQPKGALPAQDVPL